MDAQILVDVNSHVLDFLLTYTIVLLVLMILVTFRLHQTNITIIMSFYCNGSVGGLPIKLKILSTPEERAKGFQFQKNPPMLGEGLLFLFDEQEPQTFHMRNVGFDIDLLGFDSVGRMVCKLPMKAQAEKLYKTPPVKFVIEAPRGWAKCLEPGECTLRVRRIS